MRLRPPPPRRGRVREVRVVNASPARLTRHPLHLRAVQRRPSARANGAPQAGAGAARGGATAAGGSDAVDHRLVLSWLPVVSALGGHARQKAGCQWWQRWEGAGLPRRRVEQAAAPSPRGPRRRARAEGGRAGPWGLGRGGARKEEGGSGGASERGREEGTASDTAARSNTGMEGRQRKEEQEAR
ncbi:unnamed protein product, partial [Prorocentrum cordatum]